MKESKDYIEQETFRLKKQTLTFVNSILGLAFLHYAGYLAYKLFHFIVG